jgi:hypothetical protein
MDSALWGQGAIASFDGEKEKEEEEEEEKKKKKKKNSQLVVALVEARAAPQEEKTEKQRNLGSHGRAPATHNKRQKHTKRCWRLSCGSWQGCET